MILNKGLKKSRCTFSNSNNHFYESVALLQRYLNISEDSLDDLIDAYFTSYKVIRDSDGINGYLYSKSVHVHYRNYMDKFADRMAIKDYADIIRKEDKEVA